MDANKAVYILSANQRVIHISMHSFHPKMFQCIPYKKDASTSKTQTFDSSIVRSITTSSIPSVCLTWNALMINQTLAVIAIQNLLKAGTLKAAAIIDKTPLLLPNTVSNDNPDVNNCTKGPITVKPAAHTIHASPTLLANLRPCCTGTVSTFAALSAS